MKITRRIKCLLNRFFYRTHEISVSVKYVLCNQVELDFVWIYGLYVHPSFRGQGLARKLLETTIEEIKFNYPDLPIYIEAEPFGEKGLDKEQLIKFYSSFKELIIVEE